MKIWHYVALIASIFVVGLLGFAYWVRQDEALTRQSEDKIKSDLLYDAKLKQHPYFLLLGLNARDDIASEQLGRYRYHREWANFLHDPNGGEIAHIDQGLDVSMQRPELGVKDREILKQFQAALLDRQKLELFLKEHQNQLQHLIQQERIPVQRLQQLIQQGDYVSLVLPPQAINPNYGYVLDLQRLSLVNQLLNQPNIASYHVQFQQLHRFTQNRLSIVEKMLMQNWMSQLIDLMRVTQKNLPKTLELDMLTSQHLSLVSSLEHELGLQYQYVQYLPNTFPYGKQASTWYFLPNQTFNHVVENYQRYFDLSGLSYLELQKRFGQQSMAPQKQWMIKNYYGEMIASIEPPNFEKYLLMTHILNNKILAFNAVNADQLDLATLNRHSEGRHYYMKDAQLCIEVPYPMEKLAQFNLTVDSCVAI